MLEMIFGRRISSVEDLSDRLASERDSENIEDLLRLRGNAGSVRVADLPSGRWRSPVGAGLWRREVAFAVSIADSFSLLAMAVCY